MTNRTIGRTPPDKANELFARLLATTHEAVETREQLLTSLAQELDLLANLQEQHLFPVLENHPETAELVRGARDDNRQTRAFLDELVSMPKDGDAFLAKVKELKRVFQQHIRNDKDELLPVVLKVLNEDEVEAVVEKVEEEIAEVEAMRAASDQPPVRRQRAKRAQRTSGNLLAVVEAAPESVQDVEKVVRATAQDGLQAASAVSGHATEGSARQGQAASNLLDQASQNLQAIARFNRILVHGTGTIALEWFGLRQERLLRNLDGMNDLLACRSMPDFVNLQSSLARRNVEEMIGNSQRLAQISAQIVREATRTIVSPGADRPTA